MKRGVLFKTARIESEWASLYPPMRDRLTLLADYINREFNKSMTITCLTRTKEENDKIYLSRGLEPKEDSLHLANPTRAADIRSTQWINGKQTNLYSIEQTAAIMVFWRQGGRGFGGQEEPKYSHIHLQVKR